MNAQARNLASVEPVRASQERDIAELIAAYGNGGPPPHPTA